MLHRFLTAGAFALAVAVLSPRLDAAPVRDPDSYELWQDCTSLPDSFEFLPIYLGTESPGFVDLGRSLVTDGLAWRAMQYTRDKEFSPLPITAGRWYGGMGADRWPLGTINLAAQFERFRVTAWEINGTRHAIDPGCVLTFETDDLSLGLYNVWVRFPEPGVQRLRIFGKQIRDFYFIYPYRALGAADPLGLMGRRVFLAGETLGDLLDDEFVHSYELHVSGSAPQE
jgi:hypothetical protein